MEPQVTVRRSSQPQGEKGARRNHNHTLGWYLRVLITSASVLTACSPLVSRTSAVPTTPSGLSESSSQKQTSTPLESREPVQIVGQIPGEYSDFIRNNGLIPKVIPESITHMEKAFLGIEYLRKFREALRDNPELRGETFSSYAINSSENFPIAIPDSWTIYEIVDRFLQEYDSNIIFFDENLMAGWASGFQLENGLWKRTYSAIGVGSVLDSYRYEESEDNYYIGITDLYIAMMFLHEYGGHGLQEDETLTILNSQYSHEEAVEIITSPNRWSEFQRIFGSRVKDNIINIPPVKSMAQIESIQGSKPHEAQANAVAYMLLWRLEQLNNSMHFPGAGLYDIRGGIDPQLIEKFPYYWQNFFELYRKTVLATHNALNAEWLVESAMREYPNN